jgi:hypothetical protein
LEALKKRRLLEGWDCDKKLAEYVERIKRGAYRKKQNIEPLDKI